MFLLHARTPLGRRGRLDTPHGSLETPMFFPVATAGAMRGITQEDLLTFGAQGLLCNTYHLHLQPGDGIVEQAGGLHRFLSWEKPILTDSGGFQVFSLRSIRKITEDGVHFQSHLNGAPLFLGPEEAITIQHRLGSDIIMCFDECPPSTAPRDVQIAAVDRTIRWAKRCKEVHLAECARRGLEEGKRPLLFGIVQGGLEPDQRRRCAEELIAIGFDGYAIGGLAVGETEEEMYAVLDYVCPVLPEDKPRYLMGVGRMEQHREAVARGIDIFDCVLPMREARHGRIYLSDGSMLRITTRPFLEDHAPIDPLSPSRMSRKYRRSYLCHLLRAGERLGETIACSQNMALTLKNMRDLSEEIDRAAQLAASSAK